MSFISTVFVGFLLITATVYFLAPAKSQWVVLLSASYVFYFAAGMELAVFLLFTTFTVFFAGEKLGKLNQEYSHRLKCGTGINREEKKRLKEFFNKRKKRIVVAMLLVNFGILFVLKYFPVFVKPVGEFLSCFRSDFEMPEFRFMLPLGISFYTFQAMGYIIDLYRDKFRPEKNLAKFALFLSFFPQIIQGPISRHDELTVQLYAHHKFNYKRVKSGMELMLWGYFKKMVIADHLAILTGRVFGNPEQYQGLYLIFTAMLSWIELYVDFSGGIDITRGIAEIFGIILPENFKRPFFAGSLSEFWRRWHITLNNWWRDYIFYPLTLSKAFVCLGKKCRQKFGGDIGKKIPAMLALLVVRVINSVWHGAYIIYFVGGLYHGLLIALAFLLEPQLEMLTRRLKINTQCLSWKLFRVVRTFILLSIPRLFYAAESWTDMISYIRFTFGKFNPWIFFDESWYKLGLDRKTFQMVIASMLVVLTVSIFQEKGYCIREKLEEQNIVFRWIIYLTGVLSVFLFGVYGLGYDASGFQYMQF
ncbi:MAG: MBOAT family protein [Lachnospiraceae bacterium]|nr:MBOAT family protein [Lachnospiraceae bacterium]